MSDKLRTDKDKDLELAISFLARKEGGENMPALVIIRPEKLLAETQKAIDGIRKRIDRSFILFMGEAELREKIKTEIPDLEIKIAQLERLMSVLIEKIIRENSP